MEKFHHFCANKIILIMKLTTKYTLLFAGLVFLSQITKAQDNRDFRIGFKIIPGFNWVKSKTSNILSDGSGIGFSFGLMSDVRLADNYFFSPEIMITSMSNRTKLRDTNDVLLAGTTNSFYNNVTHKYNLKYLEIPLTFKFRTNERNSLRFWGQVGIAPGFLISSNVTTAAQPSMGNTAPFPEGGKYLPNASDNDKYDFTDQDNGKKVEDDINFLRTSMILGAGIEYNLSGNTSFYGGLRFNNGFTDMLNDKNSKMINNILGIEIGLFF
jgi:hypothetical protein